MTTPDIFLSYNREDAAAAKRFADAFAREGLNVWWDTALRSGEAYDEVTEAALRGAKAMVVLWSPRSVVSRWVRAEATIADRCKTLVPVTIEPCERPIMFELTQTAELSHWTGDVSDKAWLAFLGDVRRMVGREAPELAPAAPVAPTIAPPPTKPGTRGEAPTLAVLPFANRSGLAEDDVFAFGMVEDVIDALSQNAAVSVLSSSATAQYRTNAVPDLAAMARELEVRYVLEGNVRRSGESLRVTAQLVEPANGRIVWTQKFDRPLSELAAMQEDLVLEVAAQLDANVNRLEVERALRKPSDLTAWETATRATESYRGFTPLDLQNAVDLATRAVAIDPDYGFAQSVLANALGVLYMFMSPDSTIEIARIRSIAERALKLDPTNAVVMANVALTYTSIGEPRLGLALAEQAVRQSPNSSVAMASLGIALTLCNRCDEAVQALDNACRFSKWSGFYLALYSWKINTCMRAGRWQDAETVCDEVLSFNPTSTFPLMQKAMFQHRDGRSKEARIFAQRARLADPDIPFQTWQMRYSRWHADSPTRDIVLEYLRAVWAETEGAV